MRESRVKALRRRRVEGAPAFFRVESFAAREKAELENEIASERAKEKRRAKRMAFIFSAAVHVVIVVALFFVVMPGRVGAPRFVVAVPEEMPVDEDREREKRREHIIRPAPMPMPKTSISLKRMAANVESPVAIPKVEVAGEAQAAVVVPRTGIGLGRGHMSFGGGLRESQIGNMLVRSQRLGVVLDASPSMAPHLPQLRNEIERSFRGSVFKKVQGCSLASTRGRKVGSRVSFYDPAAVMMAIKELVVMEKVDAIFWFCDLQDGETAAALEELEELLRMRGPGNRGVRLYLRSLDETPSLQLGEIIDRTGGEVRVGG